MRVSYLSLEVFRPYDETWLHIAVEVENYDEARGVFFNSCDVCIDCDIVIDLFIIINTDHSYIIYNIHILIEEQYEIL